MPGSTTLDDSAWVMLKTFKKPTTVNFLKKIIKTTYDQRSKVVLPGHAKVSH